MRQCLAPHLLPLGKAGHDRFDRAGKLADEVHKGIRSGAVIRLQSACCSRQGMNAVRPFID